MNLYANASVTPLIVTPDPYPAESLLGYVLRVSEMNGYETPGHITRYAGIQEGPEHIWNSAFNVEKLAPVVNKPLHLLLRHSYLNSAEAGAGCSLLGHAVDDDHLRLGKPAFCPKCVVEKGYLEALWDLELVAACPDHHCKLLDSCPGCGRRLSWARPGLLSCQCGADFSNCAQQAVSKPVAELASIIRAKVLGKTLERTECGLPAEHLLQMSLRSLLLVIAKIGKQNLTSKGLAGTNESVVLVEQAAEVLSDWPNNFLALLRRLDERRATKQVTCGFSIAFESLCSALFYNRRLPAQELQFIRSEFLKFGMNEWDRGVVSSKDLDKFASEMPKRFISLKEFSRRLGTKPETIWRLVNKGQLSVKEVMAGGNKRVIVDTSSVAMQNAPGKSLRAYRAAAFIGISVVTLSQLRERGIYEVNHLPRPYTSYHELDLQAFVQRLLDKCPNYLPLETDERYISIREIMLRKFDSGQGMADLIERYLSGQITAVGRKSDQIRDILFLRSDIDRMVMETRAAAEGGTRSREDVARILHCHVETVPTLIMEGHLKTVPGYKHPRVTEASLAEFSSKYISAGKLAQEWGTTAEKVKRICEGAGILVLLVARSHSPSPQAFLARKDIDQLKTLFDKSK